MPGLEKSGTRGRRRRRVTSGMCCIRLTLITFNLATGLAGVCVIAVGFMLLSSAITGTLLNVNDTQMEDGGAEGWNSSPDVGSASQDSNAGGNGRDFTTFIMLCISLGTLIAFISFLGCFGACISSTCLLISYVFSVGATVVFQLFVSVFAIFYREPVSNYVREQLLMTLKREYRHNNITMNTWNTFHTRFQCCGVTSFTDWLDDTDQSLPDSCCLTVKPDCGSTMDPNLWYKKGCLSQIQHFAYENLHILAFFIVGIVFLQLYGIIASILLYYNIKAPKRPQTFKAYRYERANDM